MERKLNIRPLIHAFAIVLIGILAISFVRANPTTSAIDCQQIGTKDEVGFDMFVAGTWMNEWGDVTGFGASQDSPIYSNADCL